MNNARLSPMRTKSKFRGNETLTDKGDPESAAGRAAAAAAKEHDTKIRASIFLRRTDTSDATGNKKAPITGTNTMIGIRMPPDITTLSPVINVPTGLSNQLPPASHVYCIQKVFTSQGKISAPGKSG